MAIIVGVYFIYTCDCCVVICKGKADKTGKFIFTSKGTDAPFLLSGTHEQSAEKSGAVA